MKAADLIPLIRADAWRMAVLRAARALALPDWAVGAGFVRSAVWDHLHGFGARTPLADVDVLYFDRSDLSRAREEALERRLAAAMPNVPWSARNQARMHLRNGDSPYADTEDAIRNWLESATCAALRLEPDGGLTVIAPHGLADLLALQSRPTPAGRAHPAAYRARMQQKDWPSCWPGVRVEGL